MSEYSGTGLYTQNMNLRILVETMRTPDGVVRFVPLAREKNCMASSACTATGTADEATGKQDTQVRI